MVFGQIETYAQGSSNKGTDFWLGYGNHVSTGNMVLYLTSDVNTTATVTIPNLNFNQTVAITANVVQFVDIPTTAHLTTEGKSLNGIHLTSLKPIIAYAHIYQNSVSGATLVLPVNTLGKDYYSINYKQISNQNNCSSWFFIVAVEDDTKVEITPSQATLGNWAANSVNVVSLNKGEIYNVMGTFTNVGSRSTGVDLTGSKIRSISTNGTCKKIAVFSGSSKISINCTSYTLPTTGADPGSADNLFQQVYPTTTWGKSFITVPQLERDFVIYRILKSDPTAVVTLNGTVIPAVNFVNNFYYEFASKQVDVISSTKPIQTVQYAVTQGKSLTCGTITGDVGDPEMIFLNPLEQTLNQITMYSTPRNIITKHFINVVVKKEGVSTFKLDGVNIASSFANVPGSTTHSYAQLKVGVGTHNLVSDFGFNATAYGFGSADSYGYAAGANLTAFGVESVDDATSQVIQNVCANTSFSLKLKLPYQPVDIYFDKDGTGLKALPLPLELLSQTTKDGETTYVYSLLKNLLITTPGTYPFKVKSIKPTIDDCGTGDEFNFDLIVNAKPLANFSMPAKACINNSVSFTSIPDPAEPNINTYIWDFNGEGTSALKDPTFTFLTAGIKKVKFSTKSVSGCFSDVSEKTIEIAALPVPKFSTSNILCETVGVNFTDISTNNIGIINQWKWDFDDPTSAAANTSSLQNPTHTFSVAKTYKVTLTVTTDLGCTEKIEQLVVIEPLPIPDFEVPNICINTAVATFTNKTTIPNSAALAYVWDFGDPSSGPNNTSTLQNPTHTYATPNTYRIKLMVKSDKNCEVEISKDVIVYPKSIANFSLILASCFNDVLTFNYVADPNVTNITEYLWDFNGEATSALANPTYTFTTSGVKRIKFSTKTSFGCWADVVEKITEVFPLPVPQFSTSTILCAGTAINFKDLSTDAKKTITNWSWDFGDPTSTDNTSTLQNPIHIFATAKTYNVTLTITSDLGCIKILVKPINISPLPIVDFETPDICLDDASAQFTNITTVADGSILTYKWDFGDPGSGTLNTSTLTSPAHKYSKAANYLVKLMVKSAKGCESQIIKTFTVNGSTPKADFIAKNASTLCSDQPVLFEDKATVDFGEITKIDWFFDDLTPTIFVTDNNPDLRSQPPKIYSHLYPTFYSTAQRIVNVKMKAYSGNSAICVSTKIYSITLKAVPIAKFTLPNGCLPNGEAQFTNQSTFLSSNSGLTYTWDFGDAASGLNNTSTVKDATHQFSAAGNYTIKLTITASNGCSAVLSKTFTVIGAIAQPVIVALNQNDLCSNQPVIFNELSKISFGEVNKIEWFYDDLTPTLVETDNTPALRAQAPKVYSHQYPIFYSPAQRIVNVKMNVYSGNNTTCFSTQTYAITLKAVPIADFVLPNGCLPNGEAQFLDKSTFLGLNAGLNYSWDFGDAASGLNNTSNIKDAIHQFSAAGNYQIKLTITASNGCIAILTKTFTVKGAIAQPAFVALNENNLCSNQPVIFNELSTISFAEVTKIEWFFDADNQLTNNAYKITDDAPNLRASVPKNYTFTYPLFNSPISKNVNVKIKVYSGVDCESELIKTIVLKAVPKVLFSAIPPVCQEVIPYQITQASETTGFLGTGVFTGIGISTTGIFTPSIAGVGTHEITYTFTGTNNCIDIKTQNITVYPTPTADAGLDEVILIGGITKLKAKATGDHITYKWTPSIGLDNDTTLNPTASPIVDTEYILVVTSEKGCQIMDKVFIKVLKYPEIPNTFTPNDDGVNDTWEIKYLDSYPNSTILIFNRDGVLVYQAKNNATAWDGKLNGTNLPIGMYYYIITAKDGLLKYTGSVMMMK